MHSWKVLSCLEKGGTNQDSTAKSWLLAAALCPLWVERAFLKGGTGQGSHPPAPLVHPLPQLANSDYCLIVESDSTTPWTIALQALRSVEIPWQEYWSVLPFPSPADLPHPGIKPMLTHISCIGRRILYCWATRDALYSLVLMVIPLGEFRNDSWPSN